MQDIRLIPLDHVTYVNQLGGCHFLQMGLIYSGIIVFWHKKQWGYEIHNSEIGESQIYFQ